MATSIDFSKYVLNRLKIDNLTQDLLLGPAYNLLKGTCTSSIELDYNFQECFNALTDKLDWNNPEGDRYPFDLTKPLPLKGRPSHLTVVVEYFFNNDLEFLKSSDPTKNYITSITKMKATRYEIVGIEDMVPTLWSPIKFGSQNNKLSKHKVYSTQKIFGVKSVKVEKLHSYGHFDEIVVKRADRQLYTLKEGDFVNLHLNDNKDMLSSCIQPQVISTQYCALLTSCGHNKLNITVTSEELPDIERKELYTPSYNSPGAIYKDLNKQKRVCGMKSYAGKKDDSESGAIGWLQKLLSLLEPFGKKLSQEDVNQKLLRILSPEWNTHAVVWRNKANLDTMSIDDLYNNLKVYEPEV
ncbi:hypothetical protein Tco_0270863 [Tanacetum coccineum]